VDRLPDLDGWAKLAAAPRRAVAPIEPPAPGDPIAPSPPDDWEAADVEQLAALSADWRVWTAGDRITPTWTCAAHRAWQRARYRALRPLLAAILAGDVRPGGPGLRRS
jgi:hypothetical protein